MKKLLNLLFSLLKYILLLIAFGLTLFLVLKLYARLDKNIKDSITVFLPYILIFVLFIINICFDRQYVKKNLFFNITCCLVFATNIVVAYRAMFDTNMVFNSIQKMGANFNFFNDYLSFNNIMLYGISVADIVFMLIPNKYDNKKEELFGDEELQFGFGKGKKEKKNEVDKDSKLVVEKIKISEDSNVDIVNDTSNNLDVKATLDDVVKIDTPITNEVEDNNTEKEEKIVIKKVDIDDEII